MKNYKQYQDYKKPSWAPPSWVFGPVWTFLYILIAVSYVYVTYLFVEHKISFLILLPFILNLIFNIAYTPIQFRLRNFPLAAVDVVLTWATLLWAVIVIYPSASWVSFINIPYLLWVSFASVLQIAVTILNRK